MLSIDEAIAHAREVAERNRKQYKNCPSDRTDIRHQTCEECAEEHEQLAQWLEDYKHIKQWKSDIMDEFCKHDVSSFEELIANVRNKAIDDFATKICEVLEEYQTGFNMVSMANIWHFSRELAEQLKAGVTNDR